MIRFILFFFFFFWETKMRAFMVILHPRAGNQYRDQLDEAQPNIRLFEWKTFFSLFGMKENIFCG